MTSISFDNPYLLLLAIPLMLLLIVPYLLAIRKENKSKSAVITLCLHTVIVALVSLAIAGLHLSTVKTETEVVVVADISYSTNRDLDKIDGYIKNLMEEENLPLNTKVGVVCFGKNYHLNTPIGEGFESVKSSLEESGVDVGATDISSALDYASTLFSSNAMKRVVLITDGKQNTAGGASALLNSIKALHAKEIKVDAIYTDSNLQVGEYEVQLISVDHIGSTYLNKESYVEILIQSNSDYIPNKGNSNDRNDAFIRLYDGNGELVTEVTNPIEKGYNLVSVKLDTSKVGIKDYKVVVEANHDTSDLNNEYTFSQSVADEYRVLLLSRKMSDYEKARQLYGDNIKIDAPLLLILPPDGDDANVSVPDNNVPYSIEELCKYDVFILSDVDVKSLNNASAFMSNLNTAVSKFGKTLIATGDLRVQNSEEKIYESLENMFAVKYGNSVNDPKLYALVIDTSRSMQDTYQLIIAKQSAIQLLNLMAPHDYVMVIAFSGEVSVVQNATPAANKDAIAKTIMALQPTQGTVIGAALEVAHRQMENLSFLQKQAILISDGRTYVGTASEENPAEKALAMLKEDGIHTSVVNTNSNIPEAVSLLTEIAQNGKGNYYFVESPDDISDTLSNDVSNDFTEFEQDNVDAPVYIEDYKEPMVEGFVKLPNINGYYISREKSNATVVLKTVYKPEGAEYGIEVPLCTYWNYEKGRVINLATNFSGAWVGNWNSGDGQEFFKRLLTVNTPEEKIDYPFSFSVSHEDANAMIEIIPGEANPDITVNLEIVSPSGDVLSETLKYDSGSYRTEYEVGEKGTYSVNVQFVYGEDEYSASTSFDVPYMPEYNRFQLYDSAILYNSISDGGVVSENGELVITTDEEDEQIHNVYLTVQLMALAVVLFVIDIMVRKLKWSDIKSLFRKMRVGGGIK